MTRTEEGVIIHDETFLWYYNPEENSDKGYVSKILEVNGSFFHFTAYGKRFGSKREHIDGYGSLYEARRAHVSIVDEKQGKGYKVCPASEIACRPGAVPKLFTHLPLQQGVGITAPDYRPSFAIGTGQRIYSFDEE